MPFTTTLDATALADALKLQGSAGAAEADELHARALEECELAFEDAWREVPEATANDCLVRVARAIREGQRAGRAGKQLAVAEGGTATRAPLDPLDTIRGTLARYVVPL